MLPHYSVLSLTAPVSIFPYCIYCEKKETFGQSKNLEEVAI